MFFRYLDFALSASLDMTESGFFLSSNNVFLSSNSVFLSSNSAFLSSRPSEASGEILNNQ